MIVLRAEEGNPLSRVGARLFFYLPQILCAFSLQQHLDL